MTPTLRYPVLVEGRHDKAKLSSLFEAHIIVSDGFGIFNDEKKRALLRRVATAAGGLIVACDSDGAGSVIRAHVKGILPPALLHHVFIPSVKGKERRKAQPSKEGLLGVEGTDADTLRALFAPFFGEGAVRTSSPITKVRLYADGFSGREGSAERRRELCRALSLPEELTVPALLDALAVLGEAEYLSALGKIGGAT